MIGLYIFIGFMVIGLGMMFVGLSKAPYWDEEHNLYTKEDIDDTIEQMRKFNKKLKKEKD